MATVRAIGDAAFQENEINGDGEVMDADQAQRHLRSFQDLLNELANGGAFGQVRDTLITGDTTAREGQRLQYSGAASAAITLPATLDANEDPVPFGDDSVDTSQDNLDRDNRAPKDHALVEVAGTARLREVYDALLGDWVAITGLALTDAAPLCDTWRGEFIAIMAARLARKPVNPDLKVAAAKAHYRIVANPSAQRVEAAADYF